MTSCAGLNNNIGSNIEQIRLSKKNRPQIIVQKNNLPKNNPDKISLRKVFGNIIGFSVGMVAPIIPLLDNFKSVSKESAKDISNALSDMLPDADTLENTKSTAQKILKESGLKDKGVKIHYVNDTDESRRILREIIDDAIPKNNKIRKNLNNNLFNIFSQGANAAYIRGATKKTVIVPEKILYTNIYHEIGHALNFNGNILSRALVHARNLTPFGASIVVPIALLTSLIHKPDKSKPEKDKNIAEKTVDFVAKHPVSLTALSVLPLVTEEGLASVKGLKYAKKHLRKSTIAKLSENYIKAWSTYGFLASGTILGVWAGKKVADYIKKDK